jgi:hypothetical protein
VGTLQPKRNKSFAPSISKGAADLVRLGCNVPILADGAAGA